MGNRVRWWSQIRTFGVNAFLPMKTIVLVLASLLLAGTIHAQSDLTLKTRAYRQQNERRLLTEFMGLLALPNVVYDTAGIQKTATYIADMLKRRGIDPQRLEGRTKGVPPAIYGEVLVPGATKTIVFYAHYDGQPVNPNQWAEGLRPFEPVLYSNALDAGGRDVALTETGDPIDPNWRIYGRSTSDDKAGVFTILAAYDALMKLNVKPTANLKFFFEGEEEAGSAHLNEILERHKDKLKSDLWIICDGPVHQTGRKQVLFGVRGDVNLELKVYGAKRPLHSGHYGNWAPNPAMLLARLLTSMKADDGTVLIKGFYDDVTPLTDLEKQALARIPSVDAQMRQELGFTQADGAGKSLAELLTRPSLNINGVASANVGKLAANVIPTSATAALDLRLVLGNDARRQVQKVIDHVVAQGYYVTQQESITDEERAKYPRIARIVAKSGYNAQRTPMNLPIAQTVVNAVQSTVKEAVVLQPSLGGSLPLYLFDQILQTPTITVPIANHDNNQHAENENLRLQNLWDGLETYVALMRL